ncbi:DUF3243 domain-containing protein [Bacillus sp. RO3]|nr:DUF3243 domain-containing protein [Bacillus sp. RO3]
MGDQVQKGEKLGLSEEAVSRGAKQVADYLEKHETIKVLNE